MTISLLNFPSKGSQGVVRTNQKETEHGFDNTVDGSTIPFPTTVWMVLKPVLNNGIFYQPSTIRQEQIQEPKTPVQQLEVLAAICVFAWEGWECEIHVSSNKNNNKQQTASNNQQATSSNNNKCKYKLFK